MTIGLEKSSPVTPDEVGASGVPIPSTFAGLGARYGARVWGDADAVMPQSRRNDDNRDRMAWIPTRHVPGKVVAGSVRAGSGGEWGRGRASGNPSIGAWSHDRANGILGRANSERTGPAICMKWCRE